MRRLVTLVLSLTIIGHCSAQNRMPLRSFIDSLEKQTNFRFYYLESWIDTVDVPLPTTKSPIQKVIEQALAGTAIRFIIYNDQIVLSPGVFLTARPDTLYNIPAYTNSPNAPMLRELPEQRSTQTQNTTLKVGTPAATPGNRYTLTGYVREQRSGEPLTGVIVHSKNASRATTTDGFGFYSLQLPAGINTLHLELIGMQKLSQRINLLSNGKFDLVLQESVTQLNEVVVESEVDVNVSSIQMGVSRVDVKSMKNIPKVLGENDVLKVATTLPGVKTVGEGASGLNVRGGHADQNLVTLNEATIYNTSHFLGFFSVFNPDAIRSFELYKSGIPVQYGGRLSSMFELLMRDGNQKKFSGQGGIGPVTSHLTLELPVIKDKTSIMAGARTTYSNWVLRALPKSAVQNTTASFHDYFARITHNPNDKNSLYLSYYASKDKFSLSSDTLFSYSNRLASFQWRHVFSPNLDAIFSVTHSDYAYNINYDATAAEAFKMGFSVKDSNLKWEFNQSHGKHKITYGIQSKLYQLNPGFIEKSGDSSLIVARHLNHEQGLESAMFAADNIDISQSLSLYYGVRYSLFSVVGPKTIYSYQSGVSRSDNAIVDTLVYKNGKFGKSFLGPEYRVSLRSRLNQETSLKASYNRTRQYIHMLSNTVSVSPTDTWKLSDQNILPQVADQVSLGFYRDIRNDIFEFSTEIYYKWIQNILDYKTGAALLVNEKIDQQILQGNGKAYGIEFLLRKKSGKLTGWLGYTYSRTFIQLNSNVPSDRVNRGNYFPANYDKPHDVSVITNYKITRRYSFSLNFAYSTGRPITYPITAYRFGNTFRINYSDRNAYRIPDYVRMDLGFNIEGNHKLKKLAHSFWSISIYNLLGRKNPYSVYFRVEDDKIKAYRLSIFGAPIPTVTYHFKF